MSPFLHITGRNKILFPPPHLAIKEVATNSRTEVNGPGFAPFLMYSLGVNRLLKKVSSQESLFSNAKLPRKYSPFSGDLQAVNVDGGIQPEPAFSHELEVRGGQGSVRLQTPPCSLLASPHPPSPPWQSPSLLLYPKGELLRLGLQSLLSLWSADPHPADPRARLSPALASSSLTPQIFFWDTVTGLGLPPCARGRGNKRKQPPW